MNLLGPDGELLPGCDIDNNVAHLHCCIATLHRLWWIWGGGHQAQDRWIETIIERNKEEGIMG